MSYLEYPLSPSQRSIAEADPDQPTLVLAPPGTGKTYTVIGRLLYLLEGEYAIPPSKILVLCFTRGAVKEITQRLSRLVREKGMHDDLRFVTVRTFDSFATRLLLHNDPELELYDEGYDERIRMVNKVLKRPDSTGSKYASRVRHLIVDEIQDLVGLRARMVQLLMQRIGGGFTLLGDPAQAIYGFALREEGGGLDTDAILQWVRSRNWPSPLVEENLLKNYRSSGELSKMAHVLREGLLEKNGNGTETYDRLSDVISDLPSVGASEDLALITGGPTENVCVLCRSNGELLQVASRLAYGADDEEAARTLEGKQAYYFKPGPGDAALPAWIARMLSTWTEKWITRSKFIDRWQELIDLEGHPEPEDAWRWLKIVEGLEDPELNVRRLHIRLRRGHRLPDECDAHLQESLEGFSLSTIHASKGREFDRVVVLEPNKLIPDSEEPLEEARVLYVAATRARDGLAKLERKGIPRVWKPSGQSRWVAKYRSTKNYFFEIGLPGDFDPCSPVSEYVHQSPRSAKEQQDYIWRNVRVGHLVKVKSFYVKKKNYRIKFFKIVHAVEEDADPVVLGQLSWNFKRETQALLGQVKKTNKPKLPDYFDNMHIVAVTTEVLPVEQDRIKVHDPFLDSGFCLGVRIRGMGFLCQKK